VGVLDPVKFSLECSLALGLFFSMIRSSSDFCASQEE